MVDFPGGTGVEKLPWRLETLKDDLIEHLDLSGNQLVND